MREQYPERIRAHIRALKDAAAGIGADHVLLNTARAARSTAAELPVVPRAPEVTVSLLAPLFLIGLGAIALPLWLHRLQTQSPEREPFGSAMFLEPSERRVHLKKEFRYLILMALRILVLALLAFAFAKPILQRPPTLICRPGADAAPDRYRHLVLDGSRRSHESR